MTARLAHIRSSVLSYGYWHRRFGGDTRVVGRSIRVNTSLMTIIGVTPPGLLRHRARVFT